MKMTKLSAPEKDQGFTLIETAVVLLILGFVLGGLLTAIGQSSQNTRRNDSQAQIDRIEEALYGFAQANGRLPCPANTLSNGREAITNVGPIPIPRCTTPNGFLPASTLGLQGRVNANGLLLNPWSDPVRYSVSTIRDTAGYPLFTTTTGMKSLFNDPGQIAAPAPPAPQPAELIRVCNTAACDDVILANNVPAIILARGPNFGIYTSADEIANSGAPVGGILELRVGTGGFVSREYNEDNFDDIIVWLSPNVLFSRLIAAGKLP